MINVGSPGLTTEQLLVHAVTRAQQILLDVTSFDPPYRSSAHWTPVATVPGGAV